MYKSRPPTMTDIERCRDVRVSRGSGSIPESMFPLCVAFAEMTGLTKMGWNYLHIPVLDSTLYDVARQANSGGQVPYWHVWCYSLTGCQNNKCVV